MSELGKENDMGCQSKRDFERCKVIFGAATSQILYTRLAFPPECFQLLPLDGVASRPFEEIITSGSEIQVYNKEHLRDKNSTVFFRKCRNYGLDRFLGIMTADIFPLIETENLVKFRIYFLQAKRWTENCLLEYFTFVFRYGEGGRYGLDIWRAGTGMQDVAGTESDLWQLGDYLRKLPRWTKSVQWTLAFHATEQPVDPFIGIWNFGRGEFEDANLNLQQRDRYEYARISRLEIMPLSLAENEEHDPKTSPDPKLELVDQVPDTIFSISQTMPQTAKTMMEPEIAPNQETVYESEMAPNKMGHSTSPSTEDSCRFISRKRLGTKRKPKRPLQLFEDVTSSLPPTQVIGESQSLGQRSQTWNPRQSAELGNEPTTQDWLDLRMVAVEEHHALSHTAAEEGEGLDISYNFSPHTVSRRASLFQDIPNSSEDEE
ncbi:hypothetical protein VTG60DRAFT_6108 [Thermothelomyces hinnuleus]